MDGKLHEFKCLAALMVMLAVTIGPACTALIARESRWDFGGDWRFIQKDVTLKETENARNAERAMWNGGWRTVDLPHDWSIEGEFSKDNPTGQGGWLPAGVGWYVKEFEYAPINPSDRRVFLQFDGVMSHSTVYVNGHEVGTRANGYASFCYDVSDFVNRDGLNRVAVRVDNSVQPASRWYTGCGINRRVKLLYTNDVHIPYQGVFAHYDDSLGQVCIEVQVCNKSSKVQKFRLELEVPDGRRKSGRNRLSGNVSGLSENGNGFSKNGNGLSENGNGLPENGFPTERRRISGKRLKLEPGEELHYEFRFKADGLAWWSPENPARHVAFVRVKQGRVTLDEERTDFGIRTIRFDRETGFWLNGRNMKMYGVCLHSDAGALGTVSHENLWVDRLSELKKLGVNAIRWAHNIPDPNLLELCDRLGLLVMVESFDTWESAKPHAEKGYNLDFRDNWRTDTEDMVKSARNHPCVVIYSVGNEIRDNLNNDDGFRKYRQQQNLIHELDPTRPVTMALFRPNSSGVYRNGFAEMMDVVGQNYRVDELKAYHEQHPEKAIIGTENTHDIQSWLALRDDPSLCGQFLWTGIEYLGEAEWPQVSWNTALLDITGAVKPLGLQRMSWWTSEPMVAFARRSAGNGTGELLLDWTPTDPDNYRMAVVEVYSNCQEVELLLNGRSLGRKTMSADARPALYSFAYEPGELVARGYNPAGSGVTGTAGVSGGAGVSRVTGASGVSGDSGVPGAVAEYRQVTAGEPYALKLSCDWVNKVTASVVDRNGNLCPNAVYPVTFSVTPGPLVPNLAIVATDNADPFDHSAHKSLTHDTWRGSCVAYSLYSFDDATVTATAPGLLPATLHQKSRIN